MNLDSMSFQELEKLARDAMAAAKKKRAAHIAAVRKRCVELMRAEGVSVAEVFPSSEPPASPAKPIVNPKNPAEVWTGKGRKPAWLGQALADTLDAE